jgi:hypothetical protein
MEKSGPLGAAYDRAQFMEQRSKMLDEWADYLDRLRAEVPIKPPTLAWQGAAAKRMA